MTLYNERSEIIGYAGWLKRGWCWLDLIERRASPTSTTPNDLWFDSYDDMVRFASRFGLVAIGF